MERGSAQGNTEEWLNKLEEKLDVSLHPVHPDPDFTSKLRYRLANAPTVVVETPPSHLAFLVITTGLVLGALLIWLLQRLHELR